MYVILDGECGVYLHQDELGEYGAADAVVKENSVIGDKALNEENGRRAATVIALKEVTALVLFRKDFQNIIYQHKVLERMRRLHFLQKLAYF